MGKAYPDLLLDPTHFRRILIPSQLGFEPRDLSSDVHDLKLESCLYFRMLVERHS